MIADSPQYNRGSLPLVFVLCVPGTYEARQLKPASGDTGVNLESALLLLHRARPILFASTHRYDYRISNAFPSPISVALGHKRSEPSNSQVVSQSNVARILREIEGCSHVVICGRKAKLLLPAILGTGKAIVATAHVGNKGLNTTFRLSEAEAAAPAIARRQRRVKLWVTDVLSQLNGLPDVNEEIS